eukprot:gene23385-9703_t
MCPAIAGLYLIPGLCALGVKLWFTVDHSSLTLDQVHVWVL